MPTNKNATTRYKVLDRLLSDKYHDYSINDLVEEVCKELSELDPASNGVGRRTIEKDIRYLEYDGPFLVDIKRYTVESYDKYKQKHVVKHCLRYSDPGFSIFKKEMSSDEEYLLSEALSILGQFDGLPNLDALESLRLGLKTKGASRKIVSFTKNPLENTNLFGELFVAISQHQVVEISYHRFNDVGDVKFLNIHPYLLKEYNRRWYLFGASEKDDKLLCFALDRIDCVKALPSHEYKDYDADLDEYFDDIIGITNYEQEEVRHIVFWVSDRSKEYVATKPLHESQIFYGDSDLSLREKYPMFEGGAFFSIDCKRNYELIRELSSFGENLVVLSPESIRSEMVERISRMSDVYSKLGSCE